MKRVNTQLNALREYKTKGPVTQTPGPFLYSNFIRQSVNTRSSRTFLHAFQFTLSIHVIIHALQFTLSIRASGTG